MRVGVIADTHGLLRPDALAALEDCALILHAGDVGRESILQELRAIAPVQVVRGNVDFGTWTHALPHEVYLELEGTNIYMVHRPEDVSIDPAAAAAVIIHGHTHRPLKAWRSGVLWLNPEVPGRGASIPVTVAILQIPHSPRGHARNPRYCLVMKRNLCILVLVCASACGDETTPSAGMQRARPRRSPA
jgi:putative phosphoesterase